MKALLRMLIALCLITHAQAHAQNAQAIAVIVHKSNPTTTLNDKQLIDLYMGKLVAFPNGQRAEPLDQPLDSPLRISFYESLTHKPISTINAYWSRVSFSGHAKPPRLVASSAEVLKSVRDVDNVIGYVKLNEVTPDVKVVHTLAQ